MKSIQLGSILVCILLTCAFSLGLAADKPAAAEPWEMLFDGKTLGQWKSTPFGGEGEVKVENDQILLPRGNDMTGITWQGGFPSESYEISLEASRLDGNDFFCGLTFPVGTEFCSLILGGWGGRVTGLSNVDRRDASDNQTTQAITYRSNQWYSICLRVTPARITVVLDNTPIIELDRAEHQFGLRPEVELSRPLGFSTWRTCGALRNIKFRRLN
jgi:hypothetical protein